MVENDSVDVEIPEMKSDDEAQGASADAHVEPNKRISIPHLIHKAEMQLMFNFNPSSVKISAQDVVVSESTITSSVDQLVLTTMELNMRMNNPDRDESKLMKDSMREETDYMLKNCVTMLVPRSTLDPNRIIQPFKWVLQIKRILENFQNVWYRARLVGATNMFHLRHSTERNDSTIATRTIRPLLAVAPLQNSKLQEKGDRQAIRVRDPTKAYLQSDSTELLVFYGHPLEAGEKDLVA